MIKKNYQENEWRLLYFLNIYRILLSAFFSSLFYFKLELEPFGNQQTQMFHIVSLIYFSFSLFSNFTINKQWPSFLMQAHVHLVTDIMAILLLTHASGGVSSGVGLLLMIPIAAGSIFQFRMISYFYAAMASILLLFDQFYLLWSSSINPSYPQAGILGGILFFTALITNYLARKLQDTEDLASQIGDDLVGMENLATFVMQRLQVPVMVVNNMGKINLKNEATTNLAHHLKKKRINQLTDFSPTLALLFQKWLKTSKNNNKSFFLENSSMEMMPQFALLQQKHSKDVIIFLEDVSKLTQQAQQQKLASLGRLTASIAHEIRNPLAAISHAGELLSESTNIDESDKRLTQIIDQQSRRLNEIIDTVLNLSRRKQINTEQIKLEDWLKNFLADQIHFPAESISLQIEENFEVLFDKQHLQQILVNLLQNALRHKLPHDQNIDKENQTFPVLLRVYKATTIFLDVINSGEKITTEDEKHLFEPFFTTQTSGTGLGLFMAKELAESNHASLDYIPLEDKTCFRITFGLGF
jgi:two-component system, NtrC family, sensor histidine kinase PilS